MEIVAPAVEVMAWILVGMMGTGFLVGLVVVIIAMAGNHELAETIRLYLDIYFVIVILFGFVVIVLAFALR